MEHVTAKLKSFGPEECMVVFTPVVTADVSMDGELVRSGPICAVPNESQALDVIIGPSYTERPRVEYLQKILSTSTNTDEFIYAFEICKSNGEMTTAKVYDTSTFRKFRQCSKCNGKISVPVLNLSNEEKIFQKNSQVSCEELKKTTDSKIRNIKKKFIERKEINIGEDRPEDEAEETKKLINDFRVCFATNL